MLMIGEGSRPNPTVHVPPWPIFDDLTAEIISPLPVSGVTVNAGGGAGGGGGGGGEYSPYLFAEALTALQRYLPSNEAAETEIPGDVSGRESDVPVDAYSCDEFRMYEFKVRRCARGRTHDWTECPYAHPGEKARRRDPRKVHYSGTACPDFRKGNCKRGDSCEYAHGVFECWLHPSRYRTQPCKDGTACRRRVCFFAHTPDQLRLLPQQSPRGATSASYFTDSPPSYDGSPLRHALNSAMFSSSSPPLSPPNDSSSSPPMSPLSRSLGSNSMINDVVASLRHLQLSKMNSGFVSPRGLRPVFSSLPTTPTESTRGSHQVGGIGYFDLWEMNHGGGGRGSGGCGVVGEEPAMDRVESGRELRTRFFEKLSRENSLGRVERVDSPPGANPDVGWVSELVK
ncbi:hypothetical protein Sjap_019506 [Stephania japonica]|uniref:C3H1-type domain-containing protein n=1 Tax=Stephania japonica TaxID=461633 RepID=A0AAP0HY75_9MAGN